MKHHVATITACLTVAVLAASCSSDLPKSSPAATNPPAGTSAPSPTAPFNGDGAAEIWRKADLEAGRATSFHVVLKSFFLKQPVSMDMSLSSGPKAVGAITLKGHTLKIRRIRKDLWFQAGRGFWRDQAITGRSADVLAGRWVKVRQGNPALSTLFDLTNMTYVRKEFISAAGTNVVYTHVRDGKKIDGHQTVGLTARARGIEGEYQVTINVASEGSPLPLRFLALSAKKNRGEHRLYSQWNKKVTVSPPSNALKAP
ncbi:MAG TPA: hypothetical protein VLL08_19080 [Kineosporiaceae bacterium]|nr:hypothetical protein [Kineosporiaceae bacterium]